jgi:hypothetical protein
MVNLILKTNNLTTGFVPAPPPIAPTYTFRIKGNNTATVPTTDLNGIAITNTNGVTMFNDPIRGYVFNLSGNNFLRINVNEATNITRTFWASSSTPASGSGNVYSSINFPVLFFGGNRLTVAPNFPNGERIVSSIIQTTTWVFYAITLSPTSLSLYLNGSLIADNTVNESWGGDSTAIQFGAYDSGNFYTGYLDDMRLYSSVLTPKQISTIYNETAIGITPTPTLPDVITSKVFLWEVNLENLLGNMFRNYERFNICLKYISGITSVSNKNALVKLSGLPFTNVYNLGGKNNTDIVIASLSFNLDTIQQNYSIPQYYQFTQQKNAYILISLLDISDGTDCKALINQCVFSFDITGDENFKKYLN